MPYATIHGIWLTNEKTGLEYIVYRNTQRQVPFAKPTDTLRMRVSIYNDGAESGTINCRIIDVDTGQALLDNNVSLAAGAGTDFYLLGLVMPAHDLKLRVEANHIDITLVTDNSYSFTVKRPMVIPPIALIIAGFALIVIAGVAIVIRRR